MAGTLTATFTLGTTSGPAFGGDSELAAEAIERYASTALLNSGGYLDVASVLAKFERPAELLGSGSITSIQKPIYTGKTYAETGTGTLAASAYNNYVQPPDDTGTVSTRPIPTGTTGCYVTLTGGGGHGGNGYSGGPGIVKGGGGGGGGGAKVLRSWIPRSQLGTTYSCIKGGSMGDSSFTSGGKTVTANAGGQGGTQGTTNPGGVGGTVTTGGFTGLSTQSGGTGGVGGSGAEPTGGGSPNGGGAGGRGPAFSGSNPGAFGNGTGGGGGQGVYNGTGGNGTDGGIGGGGGGGGGGSVGGIQGAGGPGSVLIEWQG